MCKEFRPFSQSWSQNKHTALKAIEKKTPKNPGHPHTIPVLMMQILNYIEYALGGTAMWNRHRECILKTKWTKKSAHTCSEKSGSFILLWIGVRPPGDQRFTIIHKHIVFACLWVPLSCYKVKHTRCFRLIFVCVCIACQHKHARWLC